MRIVFWQNIFSPHQSAAIRALADLPGCDVTWVAREAISAHRQRMGWLPPPLGNVHAVVAPTRSETEQLIHSQVDQSVHIFSSLWIPELKSAFDSCSKTGATVGLLSEAYDWRGIKGKLRVARYTWQQHRSGKRIAFVLAIGHLGMRGFKRLGYPPDKLFPYAYCVDSVCNQHADRASDTFHLVYVGACIRRKGVDILLEALSGLAADTWDLTIVGDGPTRVALEKSVNACNLTGRVSFVGAKSNDVAQDLLKSRDLLVLPSRWDGWGAVVNEAILCGVPVVCSDHCGAADLIVNPLMGAVFPAGDAAALRDTLRARLEMGKPSARDSQLIREQATYSSGPVLARYLLDVIHAVKHHTERPAAPWQVDQISG